MSVKASRNELLCRFQCSYQHSRLTLTVLFRLTVFFCNVQIIYRSKVFFLNAPSVRVPFVWCGPSLCVNFCTSLVFFPPTCEGTCVDTNSCVAEALSFVSSFFLLFKKDAGHL